MSEDTSKILIISSKALDRVQNHDDGTMRMDLGGPRVFVEKVMYTYPVQTVFVDSSPARVALDVRNGVETGSIVEEEYFHNIRSYDYGAGYSHILVTTVSPGVVDLSSLKGGRLYVDIQGFVRGSRGIDHLESNIEHIFCLKGTKKEFGMLDPKIVDEAKERQVIITDGENGSTLYEHHTKTIIMPKEVVDSPHTIGSGDTMFAHYVANQAMGKNAEESLTIATQHTVSHLHQIVEQE